MLRFLFLFLTLSIVTQAQTTFPQGYFAKPLDIPLLLSGNFGELRNNHFHAGLDLKTQGKEGFNIYAVADGYVSRIKVGLFGYGKVLYITHPNGYTSVYAHLQKFAPSIEKYIKQQQYAKKNYEVEFFPTAGQFPVKQNQIIAYSGNTGSSGGPHLHFEIRDEASRALNPLLFGYDISDNQPPNVFQLIGYSTDKKSEINGSQLPQQINFTKQPDGSHLADKINASGRIGFGIQAIDRQDFTYHNNGVYKVTLQMNGSTRLQYVFDKLDFGETRYINTFIDYPVLAEKKSRVQRLFKTKGNQLKTIYTTQRDDGYITIENGFSYIITIIVEDFKKNETRIQIPIDGKETPIVESSPTPQGKLLIAKRDQYYTFENGNVYFPENTFYDDFMITIGSTNDTVNIHNNRTPVHRFFNLNIENTTFSEKELPQVFIAYLNEKNKVFYENTIRKNNVFSTRTRNLGQFLLMKDTVAPTLTPINFKKNATVTDNFLKVTITDDLSGVESYTATLNGQWILFEYEPKSNLLTFDFADIEPSSDGQYHLLLTAKDNVGNSQTLDISFSKRK
ncbi:MAG: peptidoglycan DD-metalloendopeptidase family protein [Capnocytophaga sp.]|nr:peptidoglycan DD-metalloendopeptidase family protein [Capnocytophaga sp.]